MTNINLSLREVDDMARAMLLGQGCNEENAAAVAAVVVAAERDGAHSHGVFRLPGYAKLLQDGVANGQASPIIDAGQAEQGAVIRVDNAGGFAPLAHALTRDLLIERARTYGVAALAITRMVHLAALWPETSALAERGVIALAMTSTPPFVAPAGGITPFLGTNPMSFAWPRPGGQVMVFDQASSATARGEIQLAARDGKPIADGAGIDREGNSSNIASEILSGAQLPFGGHKGSALALMIDLLAGPLLGELCSFESAPPNNPDGLPAPGGELILALHPDRFGAAATVQAHAERLFAAMVAQDGVRLPGDRRIAARRMTQESGVDIPIKLVEQIQALSR